jgi:Helix-turn-helix domain of transposase family ISL3
MCELVVGLPEVVVLAVDDRSDGPIAVHVEQAGDRPVCLGCGGRPTVKDRDAVELADLAVFGRPARLCWHKIRWVCSDPECEMTTWTWADPRIAAPRQAMTDRAARWATVQVGRLGRTVAEVARELGCDWHTVSDAVVAYGSVLVDDLDRIGEVTALGPGRNSVLPAGPVASPGVLHLHCRCQPRPSRPAARCGARPLGGRPIGLAASPTDRLAPTDPLGGAGPVGPVSQDLR